MNVLPSGLRTTWKNEELMRYFKVKTSEQVCIYPVILIMMLYRENKVKIVTKPIPLTCFLKTTFRGLKEKI